MQDRQLARARAALAAAPLGGGWDEAVAALADAGGGWCAQLFTVARDGSPLGIVSHGVDQEIEAEFLRAGGMDPAFNPRARILGRPPLVVFGDAALAAPDERLANPFFDFCRRIDVPHSAVARVALDDGATSVIAVLRSASAGEARTDDLRRLQALLPHVASAVRTGRSLQQHSLDLCRAALDALRLPAVLIDGTRRVAAATTSAEPLFARDGYLRLRHGCLAAADPASDQRLQATLARALADPARTARVVLHGAAPLIAEVAPLAQRTGAFGLGMRAVVAFPQLRPGNDDRTDVLRAALGLSRAEAEVALALADARTPAAIALLRGVSLATVRQQIKTLHAKCGVSDRAALMRLVLSLVGPE